METKFTQILLLGMCCGFITSCIAQVDTQRKLWCDGVAADTLLRNATDCRLFIRCKGPNVAPTAGICPTPSYFSVELQKCTSKIAANCFACPADTTSTTYQSVANSCNRFIRCNDGQATDMTCGIGMGFNPDSERCEARYHQICTTTTMSSTLSTSTATPDPDITSSTVSQDTDTTTSLEITSSTVPSDPETTSFTVEMTLPTTASVPDTTTSLEITSSTVTSDPDTTIEITSTTDVPIIPTPWWP